MIVIDASALVELLVGGTPRAVALAQRIAAPATTLHAPHLIDLEVLSVLRSLEARGAIDSDAASDAVMALTSLALTRYAHDILAPRIWQLRGNITAYDASYVVLAELLGAPLVTCDGALARAPGHRVPVEVIK